MTIFRDSNIIKDFDELNIDEEQSFEIEWIGKHQQFLGSYEDSDIYLHLKYKIGTETFDRSNLKKDKFDPYITNNNEAKIIISDSYYEFVIVE